MTEKLAPIDTEQISDIGDSEWNNLKNADNQTFNTVKEPDQKESIDNHESRNKEIDQAEIILKNALVESSIRFTHGERDMCSYLGDELTRSNLESLSRPVQEFGAYSSRLDSERFDTLLDYLDKKFSTDLEPEDKKRITDELRDTYFKDTMARAGLMAEKTDDIRDKLGQINDNTYEETIHHFDKYRKDAPNYQVQIAKAYFDYFDEPTDKSRNRLNHKVEDYTELLRREFGGMAEGIVKNKIGSKNLSDTIFLGVARSSAKNYEEMHDSLLNYFNYKTNEILKTNPQVQEPTNESFDNIDQNEQSPNSLPSDIF